MINDLIGVFNGWELSKALIIARDKIIVAHNGGWRDYGCFLYLGNTYFAFEPDFVYDEPGKEIVQKIMDKLIVRKEVELSKEMIAKILIGKPLATGGGCLKIITQTNEEIKIGISYGGIHSAGIDGWKNRRLNLSLLEFAPDRFYYFGEDVLAITKWQEQYEKVKEKYEQKEAERKQKYQIWENQVAFQNFIEKIVMPKIAPFLGSDYKIEEKRENSIVNRLLIIHTKGIFSSKKVIAISQIGNPPYWELECLDPDYSELSNSIKMKIGSENPKIT